MGTLKIMIDIIREEKSQDVNGYPCVVPVLCFACMGSFSGDCRRVKIAAPL